MSMKEKRVRAVIDILAAEVPQIQAKRESCWSGILDFLDAPEGFLIVVLFFRDLYG